MFLLGPSGSLKARTIWICRVSRVIERSAYLKRRCSFKYAYRTIWLICFSDDFNVETGSYFVGEDGGRLIRIDLSGGWPGASLMGHPGRANLRPRSFREWLAREVWR